MRQPRATFKDLLKRWNGGVLKGAAQRLSRELNITPASVSQWATGRNLPDEKMRPIIAAKLGVTSFELMDALQEPFSRAASKALISLQKKTDDPLAILNTDALRRMLDNAFKRIFTEEERVLLGEICARDRRTEVDEIRWLVYAYATGELKKASQQPRWSGKAGGSRRRHGEAEGQA